MIRIPMQDATTDDLLDIREAARLLRVSETSLRRWTNAGRLPCLRIGGRQERRFRRSDLLAFIGATTAGPTRAAGTHFCGFYATDLTRARDAAAALAAGLRERAACFLVAHEDVRQAVIDLLETDVPSLRDHVAAGRLVCAGYRDSVPAQIRYWRTELAAVTARGKAHAYVVGDVSGGALGGLPFAEVLEYEAEYERAIAQAFPVVTLCQYDARTISGLDAVGVLQCHHGPIRSAL